MFDLNQAITDWRRKMAAAGLQTPEVLNELENHLREEIGSLVSTGTPEVRAFEIAVARIGSPGSVGAEFNKVESTSGGPVTIGSLLWLGASAVLAIFLLRGLVAGKLSLLLSAHIFTLTAGYGAALLPGAFGIYYVCCRWSRTLTPARQQALRRAVRLYCHLSAGLVAVGTVLGMLWVKQASGHYLDAKPRTLGSLFVCAWIIAFWMVQRSGRADDRLTTLLCICGNVIISLGWFGAVLIAQGPSSHGYGMGIRIFLEAFIGIHLFFFAMGLLRNDERTPAST